MLQLGRKGEGVTVREKWEGCYSRGEKGIENGSILAVLFKSINCEFLQCSECLIRRYFQN